MFRESSGEKEGDLAALWQRSVYYTHAARGPTARHSLRMIHKLFKKILHRSSIAESTYDIFQNHQHVCNLIHLERTGYVDVHTLHRNSNYGIIFSFLYRM